MAPTPPCAAVYFHSQHFVLGHTFTDIVHVAEGVKSHKVAQSGTLFIAKPGMCEIAAFGGGVSNPEQCVGVSHRKLIRNATTIGNVRNGVISHHATSQSP